MILLVVSALLVLSVLYLFYWHYYHPYVLVKKLIGLPGPRPVLWYGNEHTIRKYGVKRCFQNWNDTYGETCLYYIGTFPYIVTRDIQLIRSAFINKASHFIARRAVPFIIDRRGDLKSVFQANEGSKWRRMHRLLQPAFSTKKVKLASTPSELCCSRLINKLEAAAKAVANTGSGVDVNKLFKIYTIESTMSTAFGRDINSDEDIGRKLCDAIAVVFDPTSEAKVDPIYILLTMSHSETIFTYIFHKLARLSEEAKIWDTVRNTAEKLIKVRKEGGKKRKDVLQLLVDAFNELAENPEDKMLSKEEIFANAIIFIIAGNHTTAYALTAVAYLLATNPEVQDKLVDKVQEYFFENPGSSYYDAAADVNYIEMVLLEALRLYPIGPGLHRLCVNTCVINGQLIPKETALIISVDQMHRNPEYWPDPDKFDPERFHPDKTIDPCVYMGFGAGPRSCLGKKLGLVNGAMALVAIIKRFRFGVAEDTNPPEIGIHSTGGYSFIGGVRLRILPH